MAGGGCWPTPQQELLLRAALLPADRAGDAWRQWSATTDLARLDEGSRRLLPLLYRAAQGHGIPPAALVPLRAVYRHTWRENHLLFDEAFGVLRALRDATVPVMVLKGAALTFTCYHDHGVRPMSDFDVLVPTAQAERAIGVLRDLGWWNRRALTERQRRARHAANFRSPAHRFLDLHWHLLLESLQADADDEFWAAAGKTRVAGMDVHVLDPAHQLLHVCVHGVKRSPIPPLRWVADAMAILTQAPAIEWERLVTAAERHRVALPVRDALAYLRRLLDAPVPAAVIDRLDRLPVSRRERLEYAFRVNVDPEGAGAGLVATGFSWLRQTTGTGLARRLTGFGGFLQDRFWCDGPRQLARVLLQHGGQRLVAALSFSRRRA